MERSELPSVIERYVKEDESRQGPALFSLHIDNNRDTAVIHLARAIYEFRPACREAGVADRVLIIVNLSGIKSGDFRSL